MNNRDFCLYSQAFRDGAYIPSQYTHKGQNVSPPLTIMYVPKAAKSLALIMNDPDAVGGDFAHWLVWDIPSSTEVIAANSLPVGASQGTNDAGHIGYTGPAPPAGTGTHRYIFNLYALDESLGLPPTTKRHQLEQVIQNHVVASSELTGLFDADR